MMDVVDVKFQDGVFVPLRPITVNSDYEAVVVIGEKRHGKRKTPDSSSKDKAAQYFMENFPDLDISEKALALVGILGQRRVRARKEEYYEYLERKYR